MTWNLRQCDVFEPELPAQRCRLESREEWFSDGCHACVERSKHVRSRYRSEYRLIEPAEDRPLAPRSPAIGSRAARVFP
jgi:hypothetical protein